MTDELRTLIESTVAEADGLCLDNPDDCETLIEMLLAQDAPCPDCRGSGQIGRMTQDGTTMYIVTCDKCGGSGRAALAAPEPPSPATVNEDGRGEYPVAEMWRGYAEAAEERADTAEWAVGELRAALEDLLESGCTDYVNPRTDDVSCAVCGAVSRHPMRHAAGCAVQAAEDALKDTADVGELARKLAAATEAHRALVEAARSIEWEAVPFSDQGGGFTISEDAWLALHAALAALEGESHD